MPPGTLLPASARSWYHWCLKRSSNNSACVCDSAEKPSPNQQRGMPMQMFIAHILMLLLQDPAAGVIAGRVLDPSGGPVANVALELMQYEYRSHASLGALSDHPELWSTYRTVINDRGEY